MTFKTKEDRNLYLRRWRLENHEHDLAYHRVWSKTPRARETRRKHYGRIKAEGINYYSAGWDCCACCGQTGLEFLGLDHINGGGRKHRKELRGTTIYNWVHAKGYPPGFQVLCHNCNQAKGYFKFCPHERIMNLERVWIDEEVLRVTGGSRIIEFELKRRREAS